ncbi:hypothetical protein N878_06730 [Pseudomonas sp. EGD-AK9]|nr:hypothetical protein N878_06730 [Pseudomonas sp. EGD-AK9]
MTGQLLELVYGYCAHHRGFQSNRIAGVAFLPQGIETYEFTRQVKAGDLVSAIGVEQVALEGSRAHGIHMLHRIACANQVFVLMQRPGAFDDALEATYIGLVKAERKAQAGQ